MVSGNVDTEGDYSVGIYADGTQAVSVFSTGVTGARIAVERSHPGRGANGIFAYSSGGNVTVASNNLSTLGDEAFGISANAAGRRRRRHQLGYGRRRASGAPASTPATARSASPAARSLPQGVDLARHQAVTETGAVNITSTSVTTSGNGSDGINVQVTGTPPPPPPIQAPKDALTAARQPRRPTSA